MENGQGGSSDWDEMGPAEREAKLLGLLREAQGHVSSSAWHSGNFKAQALEREIGVALKWFAPSEEESAQREARAIERSAKASGPRGPKGCGSV